MGGEQRRLKRKGIYIYIYTWQIHTDAQPRPPQHCKAIMLQLKKTWCGVLVKKKKVLVTQLCPTLCNPMAYSPPGASDLRISQARILEWVAIPFPRGFSLPRDQILVSRIPGRFFTVCATREDKGTGWWGSNPSFAACHPVDFESSSVYLISSSTKCEQQ